MVDRWNDALRRADEELGHVMGEGLDHTAKCWWCGAQLIGHEREDGTIARVTGAAVSRFCDDVVAMQEAQRA